MKMVERVNRKKVERGNRKMVEIVNRTMVRKRGVSRKRASE